MELFTESTRRDPYPLYARLRHESPVLAVPGANLWLLLTYDLVKRALHDHEGFSSNVAPSRGVSFQWLLFMDPPRHAKLRAIISRAFTPRSIANLEPRIRELSCGLLDVVMDRGELDLVADYATPLPLMVIGEMLGVPVTDWRRLARWSETIVNLGNTISGVGAEAASDAFVTADREMRDYFLQHVEARRAQHRDDLLTRLCTADVDGERLEDDELVRFCQLLLAAGTETTTNLIDNAVLSLIEHPDALATVHAHPELIPEMLEEVLRLRTPVQAMFRATRTAMELGGIRVPAGAFIVASIGAANRDPAQFHNPDTFDITRRPNPHVAFGHGIHFCLGAPLSRLEARIALTDLLSRFARFELSAPSWQPRAAFHVHGPASLPLRFERR